MPRPQPSISPPLNRAVAIFSFTGSECGRFRKSFGPVPGGNDPGFINSTLSSKIFTLGTRASPHHVLCASRFSAASRTTFSGTVSTFLLSKSSWSPDINMCLRQKSSIACSCWNRFASTTSWSRNLSITVPSNLASLIRQCENRRVGSFPNSTTAPLVKPSPPVSTLNGRNLSSVVLAEAALAGILPLAMPLLMAATSVLLSISFSLASSHGVNSQLNFFGLLSLMRSSNISLGIGIVVFSTL